MKYIVAFGIAAVSVMGSPAAYSYQIDAPAITGNTNLLQPPVVNEVPPGAPLTGLNSAFGQTFVVGVSENVLQSFSFWVRNYKDVNFTGNAKIRGYIAEVDAAQNAASGPVSFVGSTALFASTEVKTITWNSYGEVRFDTGGIVLKRNTAYAAFISGMGVNDGVADRFLIAPASGDPISGGRAIGLRAADSATQIEGQSGALGLLWRNGVGSAQANNDLGFRATFTAPVTNPVPEPETWAMMLLGLGVVGYAARRRASR